MEFLNDGDQLGIRSELDRDLLVNESSFNHEYRFGFSSERRVTGIILGIVGALCLAGGAVVITQLSHAPFSNWILFVDSLLVSILLIGASAIILMHAVRNAFGGVTVDQNGITLSPLFCGGAIRWSAIHQWGTQCHTSLQLIWLRIKERNHFRSITISSNWLSENDLKQVVRQLKRHVPSHERTH